MRYFLIAGEASGDLHASNLMHEIKKNDSQAEFCFLGGDLMKLQGGKQVIHYREMAYMGFIAVLLNIFKVLKNFRICKNAIIDFKPNAVILVDYPGFNLKIAKFVHEKIKVPVYYYISPKIWAWKENRIKSVKRYVDQMFTIFPFETDFYNKHNFKVTYVGNPTVDAILNRPNQNQSFLEFINQNQLPEKPVIALLPGSRKQEIAACLPKMIKAASHFTGFQIIISGAPGVGNEYYLPFTENQKIPVLFNQTYELIQQADAAIVNSGTATLETALIGTPMVVVYSVPFGKLAIWAKNIFLKVKYISLVNIILNKELVKELIAHHFTVKNIENELFKILNNEDYCVQMTNGYHELRKLLGETGAAQRAASEIVKLSYEKKI